jgi:hypothetical protein
MAEGSILFGLPITASSCLFCSGNADTVAVKAKAAAIVLVKCMVSLFCRKRFLCTLKDVYIEIQLEICMGWKERMDQETK